MREQWRQNPPARQNLTFFERVMRFNEPPQNRWEGAAKGLFFGATITSFLLTFNLIKFEPESAKKVLTFYAGIILIFAGWGVQNERPQVHHANINR